MILCKPEESCSRYTLMKDVRVDERTCFKTEAFTMEVSSRFCIRSCHVSSEVKTNVNIDIFITHWWHVSFIVN